MPNTSDDEYQGCTDGGCIFGHPGGMHTNGGCHCLPNMRLLTYDEYHAIRRKIIATGKQARAAQRALALLKREPAVAMRLKVLEYLGTLAPRFASTAAIMTHAGVSDPHDADASMIRYLLPHLKEAGLVQEELREGIHEEEYTHLPLRKASGEEWGHVHVWRLAPGPGSRTLPEHHPRRRRKKRPKA